MLTKVVCAGEAGNFDGSLDPTCPGAVDLLGLVSWVTGEWQVAGRCTTDRDLDSQQ